MLLKTKSKKSSKSEKYAKGAQGKDTRKEDVASPVASPIVAPFAIRATPPVGPSVVQSVAQSLRALELELRKLAFEAKPEVAESLTSRADDADRAAAQIERDPNVASQYGEFVKALGTIVKRGK